MELHELYFESLDSTSTYLKRNAEALPSFTFVRTSFQSEGRGSKSRGWEANPNENLLFSLLIKTPFLLQEGGFLSLVAAASLAKTLEADGVKGVSIKWPNDVYVKGRKIAGILLEGNLPNYLIIGMGVNLNQKSFPSSFRHEPTSLAIELGRVVEIDSFKDKLFLALQKDLLSLEKERKPFLSYFESHDYLASKNVVIQNGDSLLEGVGKGVDESFALLLEQDKKITRIVSGEIVEIKD